MSKIKSTIIASDLDGVVCEFYYPFSDLLRQLFDKPERPIWTEDCKEWGIEWLGLSEKQEDETWDAITKKFWWFLDLPELEPGIVKRFASLISNSNDHRVLYFVTSRSDTDGASAQIQSHVWLQRHGIPFPNVVVSKDKGNFCKSVKANFFVDDRYTNVRDVLEKSPETKSYFMVHEYGKPHVDMIKDMGGHIIYDVNDFLQAVINE